MGLRQTQGIAGQAGRPGLSNAPPCNTCWGFDPKYVLEVQADRGQRLRVLILPMMPAIIPVSCSEHWT